jgi:hypothetical protein
MGARRSIAPGSGVGATSITVGVVVDSAVTIPSTPVRIAESLCMFFSALFRIYRDFATDLNVRSDTHGRHCTNLSPA